MPTSLSFAEHGEGIGNAAAVIRANAVSAGLDAPVPSCPGWAMLDLVLHVGMAHRWALANLRGLPPEQWPIEQTIRAEGLAAGDVLDWFDDGMAELLHVLASSPEDLQTFFFLKDAPRPREAWARRQCHETTIHGVDAMAARLGRVPTAAETWIKAPLAVDGIDELLTGFVPRKSGRLRTAAGEAQFTIEVRATDVDRAWTMRVSADPVITSTGNRQQQQAHGIPDVLWEGTAAGLYLAVWNRGEEFTETADESALQRWRRDQQVRWS
ncbi:MAG: maleylpyruvate isomerase family mycothiol-dependent enzyme [Candidatus Phosphoribacter sp.]|nr:maleylpyruvate isomerase family mycothiol-dependent enzyme [Actinomycetales bacterium]